MTTRGELFVPVDAAKELSEIRAQLDAISTALAPAMRDFGWMPVKEAAKHYETSVSTINRWVKSGRLIAKGAGGTRRVKMKP